MSSITVGSGWSLRYISTHISNLPFENNAKYRQLSLYLLTDWLALNYCIIGLVLWKLGRVYGLGRGQRPPQQNLWRLLTQHFYRLHVLPVACSSCNSTARDDIVSAVLNL